MIFIKVGLFTDCIFFCLRNRSRIETCTVKSTYFCIFVCFQIVFAVIVLPSDLIKIDVGFVPIAIVLGEHDFGFCGVGCYTIRSAISNVILRLAILISCVGRIEFRTEFAALRFIEASAKRSKYVVTEHCSEVGFRLGKSVHHFIIAVCFDADFVKRNCFGIVLCRICDNALDKIFETALCVEHVLETCHEVVCLHFSNFLSL